MFMDVTGLRGLTAFVRRLNGRRIAFFAYNWQPQPRRLLDLIDALYLPTDRDGHHSRPTQLLRRSLRNAAFFHRVPERRGPAELHTGPRPRECAAGQGKQPAAK